MHSPATLIALLQTVLTRKEPKMPVGRKAEERIKMVFQKRGSKLKKTPLHVFLLHKEVSPLLFIQR